MGGRTGRLRAAGRWGDHAAREEHHALSCHWDWRPEWKERRACWFWYFTFDAPAIERCLDPRVLEALRSTPWLDPVPSRWLHLTVCEVGYDDELDDASLDAVHDSVIADSPDDRLPWLQLGPLQTMRSAVVLRADGGEQLRWLQQGIADATASVVGRPATALHPPTFWPHVSLGYANRTASAREVDALFSDLDQGSGWVRPTGLEMVAVTRQAGHYRWTTRRRPVSTPIW